TAESFDANQLLIYSSGILLGILIWDFCMAIARALSEISFMKKALRWLTGAAGVSLIVFGFYFGWQGIQMLIS
ncbi:amino acid transporter, partial [Bacillus amyloliquefaciens]